MNEDELLALIGIDPDICFGKPHIKGTRIKVSFILELLASKWSIKKIVEEYDHIDEQQIQASLVYAQMHLDENQPITA